MERKLLKTVVCGLLVAALGAGLAVAGDPPRVRASEEDPTAGTFVRTAKPAPAPVAAARAKVQPGGVRSVGDTCADAIVISGLPSGELNGDTCGYANDYDEACSAVATAPDMVYSFTAPQDMYIDIDLCSAAYDTKLYVYEGACPGTLIGCSDDDCGEDGWRSHLLSVPVLAGVTYYIVVDGYGEKCGAYTLYVTEGIAPPACPAGSLFATTVDVSNGHGLASDEASDWRSYAYITDVSEPFVELTWWGINLDGGGLGNGNSGLWEACDKDPNVSDPNLPDPYERVEITVFDDDGGLPGLPLCGPYFVKPQRSNTGFVMDGTPLYEYRALIPACRRDVGVGIGTGWVSIYGLDDGQACWHQWATHGPVDPNGPTDMTLQYQRSTGQFKHRYYALSLCLGAEDDPNYRGACCDPIWYGCRDDVLGTECIGSGPWAVFGYTRHDVGVSCDEMVPPCEPWVGACCYADGTCAVRSYLGCEWHAGDLNCNGSLGFEDINPFVDALLAGGPEAYAQLGTNCNYYLADITGDTPPHVGFEDINPFVDLLIANIGYYETGTWLGPDAPCSDCPCVVPCPAGSTPELEVCGTDDNDGCGSTADGFEPLVVPDLNALPTVVCGTVYADGVSSDRDQFILEVSQAAYLGLRVEAEFPVRFGFLQQVDPGVAGCSNLTGAFEVEALGGVCEPGTVGLCVEPGTYYVGLQPLDATALVDCPAYTLALASAPCGACCLPTGDCLMTSENDCVNVQEGDFHISLVCDPNNWCPQPQLGRCCVGNPPVCHHVSIYDCDDLGGVFEAGMDCNEPCRVPAGEDCGTAGVITGLPFAGLYNNDNSSADGPPGSCDPYDPPHVMQNDLWWRWTAPASGCYAVVRATPTDYNMVLVVWQSDDCTLGEDEQIGCACRGTATGNIESIGFDADPNTTYFIQIGDAGTREGGGPTLLEMECSVVEGACCNASGGCTFGTARDCLNGGGLYLGDGIACGDPNHPCPQPSPGDNCLAPVMVTLDPTDPNSLPYVDANQRTCGRGDDFADTCLGGYDEDEDIVYRLDVVDPVSVRFRIDPKGSEWSGMALLSACPDPNVPVACIAHVTDSNGDGLPYGISCVTLDPNFSPYYLVIDSWSGFCLSDFDLRIDSCESCAVVCDPNLPDTFAEGEPTCQDGYVDTYNSGCDDPNDGYPTTPLACGQTVCGESGTFLLDPNDLNDQWRDVDWYAVELSEARALGCTVEAEFPARVRVFDSVVACATELALLDFEVQPCDPPTGHMTGCLPPGTYWVLIHPIEFEGVPCGAKYRVTAGCQVCDATYCLAWSEACEEYIASVTVVGNDPNNGYERSDDTCEQYIDYTNDPISMTANESYSLTVNVRGYNPNYLPYDIVNAWVDWEGDGFGAADTAIEFSNDGDGVFSAVFAPAVSGNYRMRVRLEYNRNLATVGPCGETGYGEVEDYQLNIQPAK